jgi:hypothetical protein
MVNNRYYRRVLTDTSAGYAVRDLDRATLAALLADPDEPFRQPGTKLLKHSASSTVGDIEIVADGVPRRFIYKRFSVTSWRDPWTALLRWTPTLRSWIYGHGLRDRLLPTPRPLAIFHRRRHGLSWEGYLLTEKIDDAVDLRARLIQLLALCEVKRRLALRTLIDQTASLIRELHRRRLSHRDLKAANILVQSPRLKGQESGAPPSTARFGSLWLIDLAGMAQHRKLPRVRRVQNLARLHASFRQDPALTRTDKLRFLRVYLQWGLYGHGGWKRWWHEIERATGEKVARNLRSGRPLA